MPKYAAEKLNPDFALKLSGSEPKVTKPPKAGAPVFGSAKERSHIEEKLDLILCISYRVSLHIYLYIHLYRMSIFCIVCWASIFFIIVYLENIFCSACRPEFLVPHRICVFGKTHLYLYYY